MQRINMIDGWEKVIEVPKATDIIGYRINYYQPKLKQTISLIFCCHGGVQIDLIKIVNYSFTAYDNLREVLLKKTQKGFTECESTLKPVDKDGIHKIENHFRSCPYEDLDTLKTAILIIANIDKIPQEMISDILLETESLIKNQKEHMEDLTNRIISQDAHTIEQIKKYLSAASPEQSQYLMQFIQQLSAANRFYDAIVWCQITPQSNVYFEEINRIGLDAILQLQFMIKISKEEKNKEVTFPSNQPQVAVSYLEASFKFLWKIAEKSRKDSDITLAFRYLGVLSGKSGLEKTYVDATQSKVVDILIEYARDFKHALEKNKRMAEEIKQLKSRQGKVNDFWIFNQSSSSTSAHDQVRERRKLQRRITQ